MQLVLDGGIQCLTADHVGMHCGVLLVLLSRVESLNGVFHLFSGGEGLLLPPGVIESVEAVQGLSLIHI